MTRACHWQARRTGLAEPILPQPILICCASLWCATPSAGERPPTTPLLMQMSCQTKTARGCWRWRGAPCGWMRQRCWRCCGATPSWTPTGGQARLGAAAAGAHRCFCFCALRASCGTPRRLVVFPALAANLITHENLPWTWLLWLLAPASAHPMRCPPIHAATQAAGVGRAEGVAQRAPPGGLLPGEAAVRRRSRAHPRPARPCRPAGCSRPRRPGGQHAAVAAARARQRRAAGGGGAAGRGERGRRAARPCPGGSQGRGGGAGAGRC